MPKSPLKLRFLLWIIPIAVLIGLATFASTSKSGWNEIISSDGRGYYHYLLEYFVSDENRDLNWEKSYLSEKEGEFYTKYSVGTSLMLSPFFAMAYGVASITGHELSGYSTPFQLFVRIGSLFYLILGGFLLYRLLLTYSIQKGTAYITVIAILFGTNLLYYGVVVSAMSHVYSFAIIAGFALCIRNYFKTIRLNHLLLASVMLGLVFLLRPFNILVLLAFPLLVLDLPNYKFVFVELFRNPQRLIIPAFIFLMIISFQALAWHHQTGDWMLYSYANEGFYFDDPRIFNVLFSFNKGLFIYTPLLLVSIAGVWQLYRRQKMLAVSFISFFVVITYFISSWWCWNYASHFGMRPYIDFYAFFAIPLAVVMNDRNRIYKAILALVVSIFIFLNLIQSYQTKAQILHPIGMNFQQYKHVFLHTGEEYEHCLGGHNGVPVYAPDGFETIYSDTLPDEILVNTEFPKGFRLLANQQLVEPNMIHWKISLEKFEFDHQSASTAMLVLVFSDTDSEPTYYYTFKLNEVPVASPEKWTTHTYGINTPSPSQNGIVDCYIWNREIDSLKVRNFQVQILSAR